MVNTADNAGPEGRLRSSNQNQHRLELLLFRLGDRPQLYGINVFKVREITRCPHLVHMPYQHPAVRGIADFRGDTMAVIDMSAAMGGAALAQLETGLVVISEFNLSHQGLLVSGVERIINLPWHSVQPAPAATRGPQGNYLTAVIQFEQDLIEIIDIERIFEEVTPQTKDFDPALLSDHAALLSLKPERYRVILVDDSSVARNQIQRAVAKIAQDRLHCVTFTDGKQALDFLLESIKDTGQLPADIMMVISDVEMPVMDGYTLASEIRAHPVLKSLHLLMHSSLSGEFNETALGKVQIDGFITKFQPDALAQQIYDRLKVHQTRQSTEVQPPEIKRE